MYKHCYVVDICFFSSSLCSANCLMLHGFQHLNSFFRTIFMILSHSIHHEDRLFCLLLSNHLHAINVGLVKVGSIHKQKQQNYSHTQYIVPVCMESKQTQINVNLCCCNSKAQGPCKLSYYVFFFFFCFAPYVLWRICVRNCFAFFIIIIIISFSLSSFVFLEFFIWFRLRFQIGK